MIIRWFLTLLFISIVTAVLGSGGIIDQYNDAAVTARMIYYITMYLIVILLLVGALREQDLKN